MECVKQCIANFGDQSSEFGNLAYSPLTLSQIRERQEWNSTPLQYTIGSDSKGPVILRYAYLCQRGLYPDEPDKENQDAFKVTRDFDGEKCIMMGVFDGHGEFGDDCSGFVRDNIDEFLSDARREHNNDLEKAFRACFRRLNSEMHYNKDFSDKLSGTTAVVAFFEKTAVWVANVGDSRAIVGKVANGELKPTALSTDQTPYRKDERERIRAAGGEIMSVDQRDGHVPMHDNWDVDLGAETDTDGDPPRVWVPGKEKPGCAFTRSIGDAMGESVGVIADPELTKKELKEHDKFVCLCSDGVWEFLTNISVAEMINSFDDPLAACRAVVAESYRLWLQYDIRTDDITMILAYVEFANAKKKAEPKGGGKGAAKGGTKGRGSIRGSVSIGGDLLKQGGGARPVRRGLSKAKRGVIAAMMGGEEGSKVMSMDQLPKVEKSEAEMTHISTALDQHFLFAQLTSVQKEQAYAAMRRAECAVGDVVYRAGDTDTAFYVVDSGEFARATPSADGKEEVATIKASSATPYPTFGELALMHSNGAPATVTCAKAGLLWAMDRTVFKAVIASGGAASNTHTRALETLKSIDVFSSLKGEQLRKIAAALEEKGYAQGDRIVTQGDTTQSLYLIMEGHVRCTSGAGAEEELLMELPAGSYFGERSLLFNAPRAATVIADRPTTCLYMSKEVFEQHLGPLQALMDKDRQMRERVAKVRHERQVALGLENAEVSDFRLDGLACDADWGQWVLATKSSQSFTFKAIDIAKANESHTTMRVMHECRLATKMIDEHAFVPCALHNMKSAGYLLTVFHTRVSMDLHTALQDYGPFDEVTALFYAANVFLGLEHLHSIDIAYRNINPEAITLREDGYAMLMDMRFAKEVEDHKLFDLCGLTPYLAPEQVSGIGHTHAVDYWALGILVYEMLTEHTPFVTPGRTSEESIYASIASHFPGGLVYPEAFSLELVGILDRLLEPTPANRLCSSKQFRSDPWLEVVNWASLEACQAPAPFAPETSKHITERVEHGHSDCLPAAAYKGPTSWFEGFAKQGAEDIVGRNSFSHRSSTADAGDVALDAARMSVSGSFNARPKVKKGSFKGKEAISL